MFTVCFERRHVIDLLFFFIFFEFIEADTVSGVPNIQVI